jgi:hypothetical protein
MLTTVERGASPTASIRLNTGVKIALSISAAPFSAVA